MMIMVRVLLQVVNLFMFQQEVGTLVVLTVAVVFSVGEEMTMANPPHLPISELGTVLNSP